MNCEDGHERRLLDKKTVHKSHDRERSKYFMNTRIQKTNTRPSRDATALTGSGSVFRITDPGQIYYGSTGSGSITMVADRSLHSPVGEEYIKIR
jgi:hypothetical protein